MKIVLIHYAAAPVVGGVETVMARHARLMADAGHRVCVVAGRGQQTNERIGFNLVPEADSRDPEVLNVKADLDAGRVPSAFEPLSARIEAELSPVTDGADWVIAHNICSLNKNLPLTAALHRLQERGGRPRFILWHHDLAWTTPRYAQELHDGYPWDLLRTDWPSAEQVVVSSQRQEELADLLRVPAGRIRVIPNGVEPGEFLKLEAETANIVDQLDLAAAAPLLLLPVRITPRKNIELAIRAVGSLQSDMPEAKLLVTGPLGPHNAANAEYFQKLLTLRKELGLERRVCFLAEVVDHPISDAVIADLYKLSDALVLPSREEGFGIPVLEAGLTGVPVFCADIPSVRELGLGDAHYFSPDEKPERVAAMIARVLLSSPAYRLRKRVLQSYTWRQVYRGKIEPLLQGGLQ